MMRSNNMRNAQIITFGILLTWFINCAANEIKITTWNLEHLQSEADYKQWRTQCESAPDDRPLTMTYCDALNGTTWTSDRKCNFVKGKNLQNSISDYRDKVAAIRKRIRKLDSDIFAFQELNSFNSLHELFEGIEGYEFFVSTSPKSNLHIGYAIKSPFDPVFTQNDTFVVDTCNTPRAGEKCATHLTRPAVEAVIQTTFGELTMLNVHLKSGCQFYALDGITENDIRPHPCESKEARLDRIIGGCSTLRKQVPILEKWIEIQNTRNSNFLILGDFNRNIAGDLRHDARLDGTDPTEPIQDQTRVGSLLKEVSDDVPTSASIIVGKQMLDTVKVGGYSSCWTGIDWIAISSVLAKKFGWDIDSKPVLTGVDFRPYVHNKAIASDHCAVTLMIPEMAH